MKRFVHRISTARSKIARDNRLILHGPQCAEKIELDNESKNFRIYRQKKRKVWNSKRQKHVYNKTNNSLSPSTGVYITHVKQK